MRQFSFALASLLFASGAHAAGDALVIGNSRYDRLQSLFGTARLTAGAEELRGAGLDVTDLRDADAQAMQVGFVNFLRGIAPDDAPLIVVMAGAFVHGASGAYLLPVDQAQDVDAARVLTRAFPVDAVLAVLAKRPGRAFLIIGDSTEIDTDGVYLQTGAGEIDLPQGVTLIKGAAPDVARFAARALVRPDVDLAQSAAQFELTLSGYVPQGHVVLRADDVTQTAPADGSAPDGSPDDGTQGGVAQALARDAAAWQVAQDRDSAEGYRRYLNAWPEGRNAAAAQQRLNAIEAEPFYAQRRAEEALELNRDQRRQIQRDLALLGYYGRGIDGLFGGGTRSAIAKWQEAIGRPQSGYLTENLVTRLSNQAQRRAAELEAEAAARRAELEQQDRAYWQELSDRNSDEDLRAYLARYPDGIFAQRAQERLNEIERRQAERAAGQDLRAWRQVREQNTLGAYRAYLQDYPEGAFRSQAQAQVQQLTQDAQNADGVARARANENAINMNDVAKRLVEVRLKALGLDPGAVDGRFDENTRRAIRQYQRARGLRVTGYVDQDSLVRLLAGTLLGR